MTGIADRISVYVRKGSDKYERIISFIPPEEYSQSELMSEGWAVDGNQAIRSINIAELHQTEIQMAQSLRQKGYETFFC